MKEFYEIFIRVIVKISKKWWKNAKVVRNSLQNVIKRKGKIFENIVSLHEPKKYTQINLSMISIAPKWLSAFFIYNDTNCIRVTCSDEARWDSHKKSTNSLATVNWTTTLNEASVWDDPFLKSASGLCLKFGLDYVLWIRENPADYCCGSADCKRFKKR